MVGTGLLNIQQSNPDDILLSQILRSTPRSSKKFWLVVTLYYVLGHKVSITKDQLGVYNQCIA